MIITIGNTKGGVGKSTLAINVAVARADIGRSVLVIDGDRQGTLQDAIAIRNASSASPLACAHLPDGTALRGQVIALGKKFDDIVIDCGGRDSTSLRAALVLSDILIVPFAPRSFDVWAFEAMSELIGEALAVRDGLRVVAILNRADTRGSDNDEAVEAVADYPLLAYLDAPIGNRKAIAIAAGKGLAISEAKPGDAKARDEFKNLFAKLWQ